MYDPAFVQSRPSTPLQDNSIPRFYDVLKDDDEEDDDDITDMNERQTPLSMDHKRRHSLLRL